MPENTETWLPAVDGVSIELLHDSSSPELQEALDKLRERAARPLSTIAGSDGS